MSGQVVLLTGASGLVGTWLRRTVPADVELVCSSHRTPVVDAASVTADLRDARAVEAVFAAVRPSLVVHAAMAVDEASIVGATANVTRAASLVGADVVHLSTDALFSGDGAPVDEQTRPDPVSDYGRWKAQAEVLVREASARSAVVRLPLVVSVAPDDRAVEKIRAGAIDGRPTRWFEDELRQPAMASDIAHGLWTISVLELEHRAGVWHLPGPESLSRFQIAVRVAAALELDPNSVLPEPTPPQTARPRHLNLRSDRARRQIGWSPSPVLV